MVCGMLMSKDIEIAKVTGNSIEVINEELLPLYLKNNGSFTQWLENRAIDKHRTNSRLLKKVLRIGNYDDILTVLKVNAATITDTYWFRDENEKNLRYDDVIFKENIFDKLALYGDPDSFSYEFHRTPELTNTGSYEKCWRLIHGHWWMYKQGNDLERFSELFVYKLGHKLGFPMARYELTENYIRSLDFTDGAKINYESADGFVGSDEDYVTNFDVFSNISEEAVQQYIKLLYMDALVMNMDRHTQNYGVLRNVETGKILSLAPNFDNNIALISRGYPSNTDRNDLLVQLFIELLQKRQKAAQCFSTIEHPEVTSELITECCNEIPIHVNQQFVCNFILNADKKLKQ